MQNSFVQVRLFLLAALLSWPAVAEQVQAIQLGNDRVEDPNGVLLATQVNAEFIEYPGKAWRKGIEGYVLIKFDVNENGKPENISVVDSRPKKLFDKAAITAIKKSHWLPAEYQSKPIKTLNVIKLLRYCLDSAPEEPEMVCRSESEKLRLMTMANPGNRVHVIPQSQ